MHFPYSGLALIYKRAGLCHVYHRLSISLVINSRTHCQCVWTSTSCMCVRMIATATIVLSCVSFWKWSLEAILNLFCSDVLFAVFAWEKLYSPRWLNFLFESGRARTQIWGSSPHIPPILFYWQKFQWICNLWSKAWFLNIFVALWIIIRHLSTKIFWD